MTSTIISAQTSFAAYMANMSRITDAFIAAYRTDARAKADSLHAAAVKSITTAEGTANVVNLGILDRTRLEQYQAIEVNVMDMRAKILAAQQDAANGLRYLDGLRQYTATTLDTSAAMQESSRVLIELLKQLAEKGGGK